MAQLSSRFPQLVHSCLAKLASNAQRMLKFFNVSAEKPVWRSRVREYTMYVLLELAECPPRTRLSASEPFRHFGARSGTLCALSGSFGKMLGGRSESVSAGPTVWKAAQVCETNT